VLSPKIPSRAARKGGEVVIYKKNWTRKSLVVLGFGFLKALRIFAEAKKSVTISFVFVNAFKIFPFRILTLAKGYQFFFEVFIAKITTS